MSDGNRRPIYGVELIAILPLGNGSMKQQMASAADLNSVRESCNSGERVVAAYEVLLAHYREASDKMSYRKCWDCGNVAYHLLPKTPYVNCEKCGSQDTRLIREKAEDAK